MAYTCDRCDSSRGIHIVNINASGDSIDKFDACDLCLDVLYDLIRNSWMGKGYIKSDENPT